MTTGKAMTYYQQQVLSIRKAVYPHEDLGEKMVRAKKYIHGHYGGIVSLDVMAQEACMSQFHFIRLFRRYFGRTPHAYLKEVRLAEAKRPTTRFSSNRSTCSGCSNVSPHSCGCVGSTTRNRRQRPTPPRQLPAKRRDRRPSRSSQPRDSDRSLSERHSGSPGVTACHAGRFDLRDQQGVVCLQRPF